MNRLISFIAFITITSLIYFDMHFFVFKVITQNLPIHLACTTIKIFIYFPGCPFFRAYFLPGYIKSIACPLYYIWLGIIAISFFYNVISLYNKQIYPRPGKNHYNCIVLVSTIASAIQSLKEIILPIKKLPANGEVFHRELLIVKELWEVRKPFRERVPGPPKAFSYFIGARSCF